MSSEIALSVKQLAKVYHIYDKPHHRLQQMLLGRTGRRYFREFWALRDISFTVPRGKVVGILGKNGAGKSTLLQIICGTLSPTQGTVDVRGRVAALLELGSGFNPEFTGLENVYLNGQILGLTKSEIDAKLQSILDFADIGDFAHQPVKTSSGMFARLAFSVAVNVEPDLLIVDEALSVGDAWFQHKSMARMRQLMESGCSVLFVSHSIDSVRALCDEAIWLERGRVKMQGDVTNVTNAYMNEVFIEHNRIVMQSMSSDAAREVAADPAQELPQDGAPTDGQNITDDTPSANSDTPAPGTSGDDAVLTMLSKVLRNSKGEATEYIQQGEQFSLEFEVKAHKSIKNLSVGFLIKDQFGQELTGESYFNTYRRSLDMAANQVVKFVFTSEMLMRGGQSYSVALRVNQVRKWDRSDNVIIFADELAMVFDVLADADNPMWFKFKMPFMVDCK